jgi:ArsR family transcriptional regulator, arsenate/arsenite/antimonite-responsive transcriptional repressor
LHVRAVAYLAYVFPNQVLQRSAPSCLSWPRRSLECLTGLSRFDISKVMELSRAIAALSALSQESRLKVFRLLVKSGPVGLQAGEIARRLKVPPNTMSSHLAILSRAGLVTSRRKSRSIFYALDLEGTRELLSFLVEDCCRGKPEVCRPLIASALAECC